MMSFARIFIFLGIGLLVVGLLFYGAEKMGLSWERLPEDVHLQKKGVSLHIPIVTSLFVSLFLTLLINILLWIFRK